MDARNMTLAEIFEELGELLPVIISRLESAETPETRDQPLDL